MNESVEIMKRSVLQELLANAQHANKYQAVQIVATNANPNSAIPAYRNWYYLDTRYSHRTRKFNSLFLQYATGIFSSSC